MPEDQRTILVVDDTVANIDILLDVLGEEYKVRVATDGEAALKSVGKAPPDLILLDVMMPGMDGFQVCRRLKATPAFRDIPVVFLTALSEDADEARGLALGAVDYIAKPFSPALVKARVRNHLELKRHREELEALVAQRTRELEEALGRLTALDDAGRDYLYAISHELRTPMNGVLGIAELALDSLDDGERDEYRPVYESSRARLLSALEGAMFLAKLQRGDASIETASVDAGATFADAAALLDADFSSRGLSLAFSRNGPRPVWGNDELLRRSFKTLLEAAARMATRGTAVSARFQEEGEREVLSIVFQGPPPPENLQRTFFDTFSYDRCASSVEDLGLAVPLAAQAVRAMGGDLGFGSSADGLEMRLILLKPESSGRTTSSDSNR